MAAFVIFDVEIRDMARYQEFMAQVKPAIEAAGARHDRHAAVGEAIELGQPARLETRWHDNGIAAALHAVRQCLVIAEPQADPPGMPRGSGSINSNRIGGAHSAEPCRPLTVTACPTPLFDRSNNAAPMAVAPNTACDECAIGRTIWTGVSPHAP